MNIMQGSFSVSMIILAIAMPPTLFPVGMFFVGLALGAFFSAILSD